MIKQAWTGDAAGKKAAQENCKAVLLNEDKLQRVAGGKTEPAASPPAGISSFEGDAFHEKEYELTKQTEHAYEREDP